MRTLKEITALIEATPESGVIRLTEEERKAYGSLLSKRTVQQSCKHTGTLVPYRQVFGVRKYNVSSFHREDSDIGIIDYHSGPCSDACELVTVSLICTSCLTVVELPFPNAKD